MLSASASSILTLSSLSRTHLVISAATPFIDNPGPTAILFAHSKSALSSAASGILSRYVDIRHSGILHNSAVLLTSCVSTLTSPVPLLYAADALRIAAPPIFLEPAIISVLPYVPLLESGFLTRSLPTSSSSYVKILPKPPTFLCKISSVTKPALMTSTLPLYEAPG